MSAEVETDLRRIFTSSEVPAEALDSAAVIAVGMKVRARRRRSVVLGSLATLLVGLGTAQLVVPAAGTPVSPLIWAAGRNGPGSESGAWVAANGRRYVLSIRSTYLGDRSALVISVIRPDASVDDLMAMGPILPEDLPNVGMWSSAEPGVTFALFPAGAKRIVARQADGAELKVSTMRITSAHDGPEFVAVALASSGSTASVASVTWVDATGSERSWSS